MRCSGPEIVRAKFDLAVTVAARQGIEISSTFCGRCASLSSELSKPWRNKPSCQFNDFPINFATHNKMTFDVAWRSLTEFMWE